MTMPLGSTAVIVAYAVQALSLVPSIVKLGIDLTTYISNAVGILKSETGPTPADFAALQAQADTIEAQLKAQATPRPE